MVIASPHYSRAYQINCAACHNQSTQLNATGYRFQETGRLDHWQTATTVNTGDDRIALPARWPVSLHARLGFRYRQSHQLDNPSSNTITRRASSDFQIPDMLRLLASAPLSQRTGFQADLDITGNEAQIGNFWLRTGHDTHFRLLMGRFDLAQNLINPRTRLHQQTISLYQLSGIGFDQGIRIEFDLGFTTLGAGVTNGLSNPVDSNSGGLSHTDTLYDNNNNKRYFGFFNIGITEQFAGLFGSIQHEASATGSYAENLQGPDAERISGGLHLQKKFGNSTRLSLQLLANQWDNFLGDHLKHRWYGGFANLELAAGRLYGWSVLYQYTNAGTLADSATIWAGLARHTVSNTFSWQQTTNLRYRLDLTIDLLPARDSPPWTHHTSKQNGLFLGAEFSL